MRRLTLGTCSALLILAAAVVTPGCGGRDNDEGPGTLTYRATTWFHYLSGTASTSSQFQLVMSSADLTNFSAQAGATQTAGQGLIFGSVDNVSTGAGIAGATVTALNDAGATAGSAIYRSDVTGAFTTALTSTSANGDFIIFNVAPGRVNLRCATGASGNLYVNSIADETTLVALRATVPAASNVTWTAVTRRLVNVPGVPEGDVTMDGIGTGTPFPLLSATGTGSFTTSVPAHQTYLVRCTKALFTPTINQVTFTTVPPSGPAPLPDLSVVLTADRDSTNFKPASVALVAGTGILRGNITPTSGSLDGYTITCTDLTGAGAGALRYADATGVPIDLLSPSSSSGIFYIYNLPPGTYLIQASKGGFAGATYADVFADSISLVQGQLAPSVGGSGTITVGGNVVTFAGIAVSGSTVDRRGYAATVTAGGLGVYSMTGVPTTRFFMVRVAGP